MRNPLTFIGAAFLVLIFTSLAALAQKTEDMMKMDLEDIMQMDITVFSVQGLTQRQTPGVLTVIDEEEITASGARDLIDVLRLVPGFDFGVDIQSAVSLGVRGIWAQEGKVLLIVDGMEMNEILFSGLALGDHFPVEHIRRVEIIRGPGTSFYGNYAELAVINIVTKSADNIKGIESTWKYGRTADAESRRSMTLNFCRKFGDFKIKALSYASRSLRSDRDYIDNYGNKYSMKSHSVIYPSFFNAGMEYRGFKGNILIDRYVYDQQDAYDEILLEPFNTEFNSFASRLSYEWKLNDQLTLTPGISYLKQEPWKTSDQRAKDLDFYYYVIAERARANMILKGTILENIQLISGGEFFVDRATVSDETPDSLFFSGDKKSLRYHQVSAFAQAFYTKGKTIPSLGLRYDRHDLFGAELLPWIGITQILGKWTIKYLFGQTFRAPSIENLNKNNALKPDKTTTSELELGYQISDNLFFIMDYYHTHIQHPIVFEYDENGEEYYFNSRKIGSQGIELESRYRGNWGFCNISYSFYKPVSMIEKYGVKGYPDVFLGFPAHKGTLHCSVKMTPDFSVGSSVVVSSKRFGYADADTSGNPIEFKPTALVNVYFHYSNVLNSKWDFGFGIYNLLNADYPYIQPYDGGHAPLPSLSREFVMDLKYRWQW